MSDLPQLQLAPSRLQLPSDETAIELDGVNGGNPILLIKTPVNSGQPPLWIHDLGSNLILFEVDHFGDGTFGGGMVGAFVRLNGGNVRAARVASYNATDLQDLLTGYFDCSGGNLVFDLMAHAAAGAFAIIARADGSPNKLTVQNTGGGTIGGMASIDVGPHGSLLLYCFDNVNWVILGTPYPPSAAAAGNYGAVESVRQPNPNRPTFVVAEAQAGAAAGVVQEIQALCDAANPPVTEVGHFQSSVTGEHGTIPFIVPPGFNYKLHLAAGAAGGIYNVWEYAL